MAIISKPDLTRVWAASAGVGDITDPGNTKFDEGWAKEIPPYEYFNFLQNMFSGGLGHINEQGIGLWDANTNYANKGWARGSDGVVYQSKAADNQGNDPTGAGAAQWDAVNPLGEANTASNVGTGEGGVYKQKAGVNLELRTIKAGSNVTIVQNSNDITISAAAGGESNTGSNVGTGAGLVFKDKTGVTLNFKRVAQSGAINVSNGTNNITIGVDSSSETQVGVIERATQAEAEAGTDNARAMTPLRVQQAIDANSFDGTVSSLGTRSTDGTWTLSSLTANKPVYIVADCGAANQYCYLRTSSGSLDNDGSGVIYMFGRISAGGQSDATSTKAMSLVPNSTSLSLEVTFPVAGISLRAYQ